MFCGHQVRKYIKHLMEAIKSFQSTLTYGIFIGCEFYKEGRTVPRKGYIAKRDVVADPIYNSKLVTKLINKIMLDGKKGVAQGILYNHIKKG